MSAASDALLAVLTEKSGTRFAAYATSAEWASGELLGERHCMALRWAGPDSRRQVERLLDGLEDHMFEIDDLLVADIFAEAPIIDGWGVSLRVEALTFAV